MTFSRAADDRVPTEGALHRWFGLFGASAAWSLQLLVNFPLVAHGCFPAEMPVAQPVTHGLAPLAHLVSAAALAVALAGLLVAVRSSRSGGSERVRFMASGGVLLSIVFILGIVISWLPLFILKLC